MTHINNIVPRILRGLKLFIVFLGSWIAPAWMLRFFYSDILHIATQSTELLVGVSWAIYIYLYLHVLQEDIDENIEIAIEKYKKERERYGDLLR